VIERLYIENLVLVEKAEIPFGPGLNILTGETGAGKSAVLSAIRLLLGMRAETDLIRKGADRAIVEAHMREHIVRRELYASGKSRAFVDGGQVSLQELKELQRMELVDQNSSLGEQRVLLDAFGSVDTSRMQQTFEALTAAQARLASLQTSGNLSAVQEDLARIVETRWLEGEEDSLAHEHDLLTHAQELLEKIGAATEFLTEGQQPIVPALKRFSHLLEKLGPQAAALKNAALELEEVSRTLVAMSDRLEANPQKLAAIEERLAQIESLKRRFGPTRAQVEQVREKLTAQVEQLMNLDAEIETARKLVEKLTHETTALANELTATRRRTIPSFEQTVLHELHELNLPHARLSVSLEPKPLSPTGADHIRFLFSANPGTELLPVEQCASGGELSRLLFAVKVALADKEQSECLIFDEIDSNVGGKTAAMLGEKLRCLAQKRQILCVTHFVQVARYANVHFLVTKQTDGAHAVTQINKLLPPQRELEFARMLGNSVE